MELSAAMHEAGVMPVNECRLLELGLKSGTGDRVMTQIAERLSERADNAVEEFVGQLPPYTKFNNFGTVQFRAGWRDPAFCHAAADEYHECNRMRKPS